MKIYVIYELWIDTLENRDAYGYKELCYTASKEDAERLCNSKFIKKSEYPWPLNYAHEFEGDSVPRYIYKELQPLADICLAWTS